MGNLFVEYFGKCTAGLADAARRGREPSPTTQENCAVMMRELNNLFQSPSGPTPTPAQRQQLLPPPKARSNILFKKIVPRRSEVLLKRVAPSETLKDPEELLKKLIDESLPAEHGNQTLKNLGKQINQNKLHLDKK